MPTNQLTEETNIKKSFHSGMANDCSNLHNTIAISVQFSIKICVVTVMHEENMQNYPIRHYNYN